MILEQEYRWQIPTRTMPVDRTLIKELKRLYPDYELVYRADEGCWVFYWRKIRAGGPSGDLLCKQFVLPGPPGLWLLDYLRKLDAGEETLKDFSLKRDRLISLSESKRQRRISDLDHDIKADFNRYHVRRAKSWTLV